MKKRRRQQGSNRKQGVQPEPQRPIERPSFRVGLGVAGVCYLLLSALALSSVVRCHFVHLAGAGALGVLAAGVEEGLARWRASEAATADRSTLREALEGIWPPWFIVEAGCGCFLESCTTILLIGLLVPLFGWTYTGDDWARDCLLALLAVALAYVVFLGGLVVGHGSGARLGARPGSLLARAWILAMVVGWVAVLLRTRGAPGPGLLPSLLPGYLLLVGLFALSSLLGALGSGYRRTNDGRSE